MRSRTMLGLFLLAVAVSAGKQSCTVSRVLGDAIAVYHNAIRNSSGSSNMQKLVWNSEIAVRSQEWTDKCNFQHRSIRAGDPTDLCDLAGYITIGENLFEKYPVTTCSGITDFKLAVDSWMTEKDNFKFPNTCKTGQTCGHYTQLIWARSAEVGCGATLCEYLSFDNYQKTTKNALFIACNYGPAYTLNTGNLVDEAGKKEDPAKKGDPCSDCDPRYGKCERALCALDESYNGPCRDAQSNATCTSWKNMGLCDACGDGHLYYNFMKKSCSETCGFC